MRLTKEEVFEEVLSTLGIDGVEVELSERDLDKCLKKALRFYYRFNPLRDIENKVVDPEGIKSYDIHPDTYAVVDVEFQDQLQVLDGRDSTSFNIFNNWQLNNAGYGSGGLGNTAEYAYLTEWRNLTRREYSLQPDYFFEEDTQYEETDDVTPVTRKIHFFNPTGLQLRVSYVCVRPRALHEVVARDHDWIIEFATAHAKEVVGRKRNKFKTVPSAGQALQLDGADLLEEARAEKAELLQDLQQRFIGEDRFQWG